MAIIEGARERDGVRQSFVPNEATIGTEKAYVLFRAPYNLTVTSVRWVPQAAVTGAATNNFAIAAQNRGAAGTATTAITATKTYASGTDAVAFVPETLTLSTTAANLNVDEGHVVALDRSVNGDGLASPEGVVEVEYTERGR